MAIKCKHLLKKINNNTYIVTPSTNILYILYSFVLMKLINDIYMYTLPRVLYDILIFYDEMCLTCI